MTTDLERYNFTSDVLSAAQEYGDKIALSIVSLSGAQRWSYDRLQRMVLGAGRWLVQHNFAPETGVLINIEDPVLAVIAKLGAISVGMVVIDGNGRDDIAQIDIEVVYNWKTADLKAWEQAEPVEPVLCKPGQLAYIWVGPNAIGHFYTHDDLRQKARASLELLAQNGYEISANDRVFEVATLEQPWLWIEALCGMWVKAATVLVPNEKVVLSQFPLLLRRHDVSVFAGSPAQIGQVLSRELPDFPKLKCGIYWRPETVDLLHSRWREQMNGTLLFALDIKEQGTTVKLLK